MRCPRCYGIGMVDLPPGITVTCGDCNGTGRVPWQPPAREKTRRAKIVQEPLPEMATLSHRKPDWWIDGENMPPQGSYCGGAGHCKQCAEEEDRRLFRCG